MNSFGRKSRPPVLLILTLAPIFTLVFLLAKKIHIAITFRSNLESLESLSAGATPAATSIGAGSAGGGTSGSGSGSGGGSSGAGGGQERVVRAFAELARNLQRMRPCVRPAMCKPYGKQSEQLQKSM